MGASFVGAISPRVWIQLKPKPKRKNLSTAIPRLLVTHLVRLREREREKERERERERGELGYKLSGVVVL